MNNYIFIELNNHKYDYLVIAIKTFNLMESLRNFSEEEIKKLNILYDMTLVNGRNSNRYIEYKGSIDKKVYESFYLVNEIDSKIKDISQQFFKSNKKVVENSCIPKAMKYLIEEGLL